MAKVLEHSRVDESAGCALKDYLRGVVGVVEANSFERKGLRDFYLQMKCGEWNRNICGMTATVGHLDGIPVCISLLTETVGGHKLVFINPTSEVVDHRLIAKWLEANMPSSAWRQGSLNRVDSLNFSNIFHFLSFTPVPYRVRNVIGSSRDEARRAFADSKLSYENLTVELLRDLRKRIDNEMKSAGLMDASFRMRRSCKLDRSKGRLYGSLRCKSHYFDDREAVTFNPDGFVGFAGWADDNNVVPILKGFQEWLTANA